MTKIMKMRLMAVIGVVALMVVACQSLNTTTFRSEKLVADGARGSVHAWNQYFAVATNGVSQEQCVALQAEQAQVYEAARKLGATLQVVENIRLVCVTNAANTNLTALQIALDAAGSQAGAIQELVRTLIGK